MTEQANAAMDAVTAAATQYGIGLLGAAAILAAGLVAARWLAALAERALGRAATADVTLRRAAAVGVRYAVLTVTLIAVLNQFGVQTATLIAVVGALSLAVSLALQHPLRHLVGGVVLLVQRPFEIDHEVEVAGQAGRVREINLLTTELVAPDGTRIVVPNWEICDKPLKNLSAGRRAAGGA